MDLDPEKPAPVLTTVLIKEGLEKSTNSWIVKSIEKNGQVLVTGLEPGKYRAFAFAGSFMREDLSPQLLSAATSVTLEEDQTARVVLQLTR